MTGTTPAGDRRTLTDRLTATPVVVVALWTVWSTALAVVPASLLALWWADRVHAGLSREAVIRAIRVLLCLAGVSLVLRATGTG